MGNSLHDPCDLSKELSRTQPIQRNIPCFFSKSAYLGSVLGLISSLEEMRCREAGDADLHPLSKNSSIVAEYINLGVSSLDIRGQLSDLSHAGKVSSKAVDVLAPAGFLDALGRIPSLLFAPSMNQYGGS